MWFSLKKASTCRSDVDSFFLVLNIRPRYMFLLCQKKIQLNLERIWLLLFFSMHFLMSLSYLHVWACHWKYSRISSISSSLPWTTEQRLVTSNSCWSCKGSNPVLCREGQSGNSNSAVCFDVGKEEQSQPFCLSYQMWLRYNLKFPLLICRIFMWPLNFWGFWQYNSLNIWCERKWKTFVSDKPFESCSSGKWSGGKSIYTHKWREKNRWACSEESETVHQSILQWLYW